MRHTPSMIEDFDATASYHATDRPGPRASVQDSARIQGGHWRIPGVHLLTAITVAAALVACGDKPSRRRRPAFRHRPRAFRHHCRRHAARGVHAAVNGRGGESAETARDSAATNPQERMSKEEESKSMPMSGQAGSHSSTALDAKQAPKK